jgi:hypothetical protein
MASGHIHNWMKMRLNNDIESREDDVLWSDCFVFTYGNIQGDTAYKWFSVVLKYSLIWFCKKQCYFDYCNSDVC